jgi:phosphate-selective porin OprO and OprP
LRFIGVFHLPDPLAQLIPLSTEPDANAFRLIRKVNSCPFLNGTLRTTFLPILSEDERTIWHLGAAYSRRDDRDDFVRFRARPEWRDTTQNSALNNRFVDTGDLFADSYDLYQCETALINGPLSVQTEFISAVVNGGAVAPRFNGGYGMISYFLTGEARAYDKRLGRLGRVKPIDNFFIKRNRTDSCTSISASGFGAWEVAARYSWVDRTSGGVNGGVIEDYTLGLNWYWNYNTRVQWNYIHTNRNADAPGSVSGNTDAFVMRLSFDI